MTRITAEAYATATTYEEESHAYTNRDTHPGCTAGDGGSADSGESGDPVQDVLDDLDFGDGMAFVTIGDESYEFALGGNSTVGGTTHFGICQTLFGLIVGGGYDTEGRDIVIEFEILPTDWESYDDGRFDNSSNRIEIEFGATVAGPLT